jgi:hypothetical protein
MSPPITNGAEASKGLKAEAATLKALRTSLAQNKVRLNPQTEKSVVGLQKKRASKII